MKSLYITSIERYSGKTAICLALGKHLQENGYRVGYIKPLSLQPWNVAGKIADEDAAFVKEVLALQAEVTELSPIVLTAELLRQQMASSQETNYLDQVKAACNAAGQGQDVLLMEGGGSLREGYVVGLPTVGVAQALGSKVLVLARYQGEVHLLDDILASQTRLRDTMGGILINRVPADAMDFVNNLAVPYFERHNLPVFGVLPEVRGLSALTVEELIQLLDAEAMTKVLRPEALVENLTVGAMTADAALSRFRKYTNKAVITGGDRTDIQLAALETSTTCLILTGNLRPSPLVVRQAEEFGVPILLVRKNTMETIEAIEHVFGKTRLGQTAKLRQFQALLDQHCDYERLYRTIGLAED
ncbi:MAG: phosphotransacetylase family protein [Anaerolineales bacterium]|nr:phosphotransacetylase family protein [Anaerolineales bacterium]